MSIMQKECTVFLFFLALISFSLYFEISERITADEISRQSIDFDHLKTIKLMVPAEIHIVENSGTQILLEGSDDVLNGIKWDTDQEEINIYSEDFTILENWKRLLFQSDKVISIYIPAENTHAFNISGAGAFLSKMDRKDNSIRIKNYGLGEVVIQNNSYSKESSVDLKTMSFLSIW